jgi:hypothetical protein
MKPLIKAIFCLFIISNTTPISSNPLIEDNPIVILEIIRTEEICNLSNGKITIILENPLPTSIYSIDNGNSFQSSNTFENLEAGDYIVIISDGIVCTESITVQISNAPEPSIGLEYNCLQNLNKVDINLTPFPTGIFPFQYNWEGPNNTTYATQDLTHVDPGNYFVTVTDRLGCQIDTSIVVDKCCEMSISCLTDSLTLVCLGDMPSIPEEFMDSISINDEDLKILNSLNIEVFDNCGIIQVAVEENANNPQDCSSEKLTIERILKIDDGVTNTNCKKIYIINNHLGLNLIEASKDKNVACSEEVELLFATWLMDLGDAQFKSCSNDFTISSIPEAPSIEYKCTGQGEKEVNFVIVDECMNSINTSATFTVVDNIAPEIICPEDITFDSRDPDLNVLIDSWLESVSSTDNCSLSYEEYDFVVSEFTAPCNTQFIEVLFDAYDECKNHSSCKAKITVENTFAPSITCPQNLVLPCLEPENNTRVSEWLTTASAEDNNAPLVIIIDTEYISADLLQCGDQIVFEFSIDDPCAEGITCRSQISVEDNEAPELSCPQDLIVFTTETDAESSIQKWLTEIIASDNCSLTTLDNDYTSSLTSNLCSIEDAIMITFSGLDMCGNSTDCTSLIKVEHIGVELTCPGQLIVECNDNNNALVIENWIKGANASDISGLDYPVVNDFNETSVVSACDNIIDISFSSMDICDNIVSCFSEIRILDTQAPSIDCPEKIRINLDDLNAASQISAWLASVMSTDDCSDVSLSNNLDIDISNIKCEETYVVEFQSIDVCNNSSDCFSEITLENPAVLELECPEPISIPCYQANTANLINQFLSNYSVEAEYTYDVINNFDWDNMDTDCNSIYTIDVSFLAIDDCNNTSDCFSKIELLPEPKVYIPNIFMPDGAGKNAWFTVYSNDSVTEIIDLLIYNRWGNKIFEKHNFEPNNEQLGWDGLYHNEEEDGNVYSYIIVVEDRFNVERSYTGTIQILK